MGEKDTATDPSSLPSLALLFLKFAKTLAKFLGKVTFAVVASVLAALILLVGVNAVLGFGILGLSFVMALLKTALNLILLFLACTVISCLTFASVARALVFVSSCRTAVARRWQLHRAQRLVRMAVRRMRAFIRNRPETDLLSDMVGIVLIMVAVLMFAYLKMRDPNSWNETLNVRLPTRAPVGRVGRIGTSPQVSKLADVEKYVNARRDKVDVEVSMITQLALSRSNHPLTSRCGNALPLHPSEASVVAELYVDLTQAPPILKHEYTLTEEQLTAALSLLAEKSRRNGGWRRAVEDEDLDQDQDDEDHANTTLDCVKLHPNYVQLFATSVDADGSKQNQSFGMSVVKDIGNLRMVLDELSVGRASFQVGWLGLGVIGSRGFVYDAEGMEDLADALRAFDSRVFSINVFEGYMHIVTWRLSTVAAARASIDVGYTQQTVAHRVEPREDAASVGVVRAGDLVYVLERTDEWLYVCSEVSGRLGWLPKSAFISLENWPGFLTERQVIQLQKH